MSMNSFELNKILGAILGTCLITLALNIGAGAIFAPEKPAKPGYNIAVQEHGGAAGRGQGGRGADGGHDGLGVGGKGPGDRKAVPSLPHVRKGWPQPGRSQSLGIVGRARASEPGFNYSAAMKAKGGTWTFGELYAFLANPRGYIPGTNMTFAGLARGQQRADVIDLSAHAVG